MNRDVINVQNVSKTFKIYNKPYQRLFELLFKNHKYVEVHALKNISFSVSKGKTLGIVGPNGSGKSTLLQIITGILQPTSGKVQIQGRISALLELGAGFNLEYTGRENIYLYSSILGVSKEEVDQKLEDIIRFAQIGDFIDKPVKTYSSGMYVRLAFSVAINVEPDILIVDEALAVGDEAFQRKCFRKFEELKEKGVTILFVTHSLGMVKLFCDEAILIYKGELLCTGNPNSVINEYTKLVAQIESGDLLEGRQGESNIPLEQEPGIESTQNGYNETEDSSEYRYGNGDGEIIKYNVYSKNDPSTRIFKHGEILEFEVEAVFHKEVEDPLVAYTVKTISGVEVTGTNTMYENVNLGRQTIGDRVNVKFSQNTFLNAGDYCVSFGLVQMKNDDLIVLDRRYDVVTFKVLENRKATGLVDPAVSVQIDKTPNGK